MAAALNIPWEELSDFLADLGEIDEVLPFAREALNGARRFIPFDAGLVILHDSSGRIRDYYQLNYDERHIKALLEYYFTLDQVGSYMAFPDHVSVFDWRKEHDNTEFIKDYIRTRMLKHSINFSVFYPRNISRLSFCLDRSSDTPFTRREIQIAELLNQHIKNLSKKFWFSTSNLSTPYDRKRALMKMANLTRRETEIALALCGGASPQALSETLHVALTTTYKHIARIYEKLNVSNLQGLLVYLLNPEASIR